jgi:hypothetical protein
VPPEELPVPGVVYAELEGAPLVYPVFHETRSFEEVWLTGAVLEVVFFLV